MLAQVCMPHLDSHQVGVLGIDCCIYVSDVSVDHTLTELSYKSW